MNPEPEGTGREPISVYVSSSIKKKLERAASAEGLSVSAYVRRILMQYAKERGLGKLEGIGAKELIVSYFSKQIWMEILSRYGFDEIDVNGDGYIEKEELMAIASKLESEKDITEMMIKVREERVCVFLLLSSPAQSKISSEPLPPLLFPEPLCPC